MSALVLFVRFLQILTIVLVVSLVSLFGHIFWGFDLLANLRVQFAWLTLLVFVILLLLRIRTLTMIAGVVLVLHILDYSTVYKNQAPSLSSNHTQRLRVMALNMWYKNTTPEEIVAEVRTQNPDVLVLLEAQDNALHALQALRNRYPYFYPAPQQNWLQMGIFSSVPIERLEFPRFPGVNRTVLEARLRTPSGNLTMVIIHAQSALNGRNTRIRNEQLQAFGRYLHDKSQRERVIAVGDFNVTPWSAGYRDFVRTSGLGTTQPAIPVLPTWPMWMPRPFQIPIDHAFLSQGLGLVKKTRGSDAGSDHAAVIYDIGFIE